MDQAAQKGNFMLAAIVGFADVLMASLVIGAMFGVWLFFNPRELDGPRYVVVHQQGIRTMNTAMPALGAVTIALTITAAVLAHRDGEKVTLLAGASLAFLAVAAITRFGNQPINSIVSSWLPVPPPEWRRLRDLWWRWHLIRLACGLAGLSAVIIAQLLHSAAFGQA